MHLWFYIIFILRAEAAQAAPFVVIVDGAYVNSLISHNYIDSPIAVFIEVPFVWKLELSRKPFPDSFQISAQNCSVRPLPVSGFQQGWHDIYH